MLVAGRWGPGDRVIAQGSAVGDAACGGNVKIDKEYLLYRPQRGIGVEAIT